MGENLGSYIALAAAILIQAIKDVRRGNAQAVLWLSLEGLDFYEGITGEKIDPEYWQEWVRAGCPGGSVKKLTREKHAA